MKKIKIKSNMEGRKIEVGFYEGKSQIGSTNKYLNRCMVCGKATVDDKDLGEKYICSECLEIVKKSLKPAERMPRVVIKEVKKEPVIDRTYILKSSESYKPDIKIENLVDYQNLLYLRVHPKVMTAIVDLIIKGYNTATKVTKVLNCKNVNTIYAYMLAMAKTGMIYKEKSNKNLVDQIFKINPKLTYTRV